MADISLELCIFHLMLRDFYFAVLASRQVHENNKIKYKKTFEYLWDVLYIQAISFPVYHLQNIRIQYDKSQLLSCIFFWP